MSNPAYQAARAAASREKIIAASLRMFVEHGFDNASLIDIAKAAGVSTATLFKHFPKKDDMLAAAIDTLASLEDDASIPQGEKFTPSALKTIALQYARRLDNPMMLGLIRLGILESGRQPHIGPIVSDAWRKPFLARLNQLLDQGINDTILRIPDRTVAVRQFLGLITDAILWPRLLGLGGTNAPGFRDAVVEEGLKTFLSRYAITSSN
ncbi:MAG: TetR/AcrR family transcriptional regulator [Alphaproteobacteria bacterium]|nr:TetR/AcrR family transcriptional regulator [Alphaproteobacteria bacterium]